MLYIKAVIKTDFHHYFYRTIVLNKGTNVPLLDKGLLRPFVPQVVRNKDERGHHVRNTHDFEDTCGSG